MRENLLKTARIREETPQTSPNQRENPQNSPFYRLFSIKQPVLPLILHKTARFEHETPLRTARFEHEASSEQPGYPMVQPGYPMVQPGYPMCTTVGSPLCAPLLGHPYVHLG